MRNLFVALVLILVGVTAATAGPTAVDVGASGIGTCCNWVFDSNLQWLGAEFTLSSTTQVSSISLGILDPSLTFYTVEIATALTGGTVEWTSPSSNASNPVFTPVSLTLGPGTYFLLGPTTGSSQANTWPGSAGILSQVGGTVGSGFSYSFDQGATWFFDSFDTPLPFDVTGTSNNTSAPDPSIVLLLGINLLGAALIGMTWKLRKPSGASLCRAAVA